MTNGEFYVSHLMMLWRLFVHQVHNIPSNAMTLQQQENFGEAVLRSYTNKYNLMENGKHAISVRHFGSDRDNPVSTYHIPLDDVPNSYKNAVVGTYKHEDLRDQTDLASFSTETYPSMWRSDRSIISVGKYNTTIKGRNFVLYRGIKYSYSADFFDLYQDGTSNIYAAKKTGTLAPVVLLDAGVRFIENAGSGTQSDPWIMN